MTKYNACYAFAYLHISEESGEESVRILKTDVASFLISWQLYVLSVMLRCSATRVSSLFDGVQVLFGAVQAQYLMQGNQVI